MVNRLSVISMEKFEETLSAADASSNTRRTNFA